MISLFLSIYYLIELAFEVVAIGFLLLWTMRAHLPLLWRVAGAMVMSVVLGALLYYRPLVALIALSHADTSVYTRSDTTLCGPISVVAFGYLPIEPGYDPRGESAFEADRLDAFDRMSVSECGQNCVRWLTTSRAQAVLSAPLNEQAWEFRPTDIERLRRAQLVETQSCQAMFEAHLGDPPVPSIFRDQIAQNRQMSSQPWDQACVRYSAPTAPAPVVATLFRARSHSLAPGLSQTTYTTELVDLDSSVVFARSSRVVFTRVTPTLRPWHDRMDMAKGEILDGYALMQLYSDQNCAEPS